MFNLCPFTKIFETKCSKYVHMKCITAVEALSRLMTDVDKSQSLS